MQCSRITTTALIITSVILMSLVIAGCETQGNTEDSRQGLNTPLGMVDEEFITVSDLLEHPDSQYIVDELILAKLIQMKAKEEGLDVTDDMVYETMQPYIDKEGGRRAFLDLQHEKGLTLEKTIEYGKIGLLQEMIVDKVLEDPTYDEVVEFLGTDVGQLAYQLKAQELGKSPDDVTVEEVYDMAFDRLLELRRRELYDKLREETLPAGHQVANLLRASKMEDEPGEAWVAAGPAPAAAEPEAPVDGDTTVEPSETEESTDSDNSDLSDMQED